MFTGNTHTKIAAGLVILTTVAIAAGCKGNQSASWDSSTQYDMVANNGSLGAGDGLGGQLFSTEPGTTRVAVIRTAETAIQVAEAKEANGSYDAWYASFDRDPEHIALAKANQQGPVQVADADTLNQQPAQPASTSVTPASTVVDAPTNLAE